MGIVSNNRPEIRQTLSEDLGLSSFFECIVISEEVGLYKPDPQIVEFACQQLGISCSDCVYVGDHPFDVCCAHDASMPAVWFPTNRFFKMPVEIGAPEYVIHDLEDLCAILL